MSDDITIGQYKIGDGYSPFIVAELSGNHNQSLDTAFALVKAAAEAGAHAVKLQTYTADTMTLPVELGGVRITERGSLWEGEDLYSLYQKAHTPWEWHKPIFDLADKLGLIAFSTPFDESAVDFLETLDVPAYKIASFECTDLTLVRYAAKTGKPLIISTGMATVAEIDACVSAARDAGCRDLVLLKCTSAYPAEASEANLRTIPNMRETFGCHVGLSDHTLGIGVAIASVALGATVIEKHVVLNRSDGGVDAAFSIEPTTLKSLVIETERAYAALGKVSYTRNEREKESSKYRRSIYAVQDIHPGDVIQATAIRRLRPATGIPANEYDSVVGRVAKSEIKKGMPLTWDCIL